MTELITRRRTEVDEARAARDAALLRQRRILALAETEKRDRLTSVEQLDFDSAAADKRAAEERLTAATVNLNEARNAEDDDKRIDVASRETRAGAQRVKYDEVARVTGEARTYTPQLDTAGEASFFKDMWRSRYVSDFRAEERLKRHMVEAEREGQLSQRALNTGGAAGLVVPQYLIDMAAPVLRFGRPLANVIARHQLPEQGMSFIVPRGTTGGSEAVQATENSAVSQTDEVWANLTVPVCTVAGSQQPSRQLLERGSPGMDAIIYMDLAKAYHSQLDSLIINGSGSSGQPLGILNTASINAATAFGAAPTATNFSLKVAGQIAAVTSSGSGIYPKVLAMHPRRWGWLTGLVDTTGRPIVQAGSVGMGALNAAAVITAPGQISADSDAIGAGQYIGIHSSGLPVLTDLNMPINVGTNSEDLVLALDTHELHLWEDGDGMPKELTFEQTAGTNLTVTLVAYGYFGFTAGRYPGATGKVGGLDTVGGQGLVAPTF